MPFRRGDQIRIGDSEGTVKSIEPRATILQTYDGRNIVVPNTDVYTSHVVVHTYNDVRRVEMDITVGYDYDTQYIINIIQNALKPIEEVLDDPSPQVLCWELGATSLGMKVRWWIEASRADEVISRARAVQAIKEAFEVNDIDPTDPDMIYYKEQGASKPHAAKSHSQIQSAPPPQMIEMGVNDPETEDPKIDSRNKTMLPDS
jgi:small conductance mechanosensitive channel